MATNDELKEALDEYVLEPLERANQMVPRVGPLAKLLRHLVNRAIETGQVFNSHTHPVEVLLEENNYTSAGSGHTEAPAEYTGYGCYQSIRIGEKA